MKILITDDNPGDRRLMREALSEVAVAFEVQEAETGEEAVDKARAWKPDLVILDTNLPGIDGFETCRQIKAISGISLKVIMLTGVVDAVDAGKAREAGADGYTVKTSDYQYYLERVRQFIQ